MAQVNIRIDDGLKKKADELFEALGLNMSTAFNIFIKTSIRQKGIPFSLNLGSFTNENKKIPLSESRGIWKGKVWMSDDFNEPLEEMKEYME